MVEDLVHLLVELRDPGRHVLGKVTVLPVRLGRAVDVLQQRRAQHLALQVGRDLDELLGAQGQFVPSVGKLAQHHAPHRDFSAQQAIGPARPTHQHLGHQHPGIARAGLRSGQQRQLKALTVEQHRGQLAVAKAAGLGRERPRLAVPYHRQPGVQHDALAQLGVNPGRLAAGCERLQHITRQPQPDAPADFKTQGVHGLQRQRGITPWRQPKQAVAQRGTDADVQRLLTQTIGVRQQHAEITQELRATTPRKCQPELRTRRKAAVHAHGVVVAGTQEPGKALQRHQGIDQQVGIIGSDACHHADLLVMVLAGDQQVDFLRRGQHPLVVGLGTGPAWRLQKCRLLPVVHHQAPRGVVRILGRQTPQEHGPCAWIVRGLAAVS